MAKVGFKITGVKELQRKVDRFYAECLSHQVRATQLATVQLHEAAVKLIAERSVGEAQIRYSPKRTVVASKPGDAPNTDTGRLIQSIKMEFKREGLVGRVGTNLKYGADLEFGTEKMAARPWLSTALLLVSDGLAKIYSEAFSKSIKEAGK